MNKAKLSLEKEVLVYYNSWMEGSTYKKVQPHSEPKTEQCAIPKCTGSLHKESFQREKQRPNRTPPLYSPL